MRRLFATVIAVLSLVLGVAVAPAAHAYVPPTVNTTFGHWSYFKWGGQYQAGRAFYVYDRSGDATIHAALQQVINDLHYDLNARNAWGIVPAPIYYQDDANAGACDSTAWSGGNGFSQLVGYSFITVCSGGPAVGISQTWNVGPGSHSAENFHPSMHIEREYPDYNTTYSMLAHELFHAMGVSHTDNCADLMGGAEYGCKLTFGVITHPSGADYDALTNFYGGYGVFNHPWYS